MHRVGYLLTAAPEEQLHVQRAFEDGMRKVGYVEGRNVVFERRFAMGKTDRLPELADELVRLNVDVIVTGSNPVIAAVKQATSRIPVVMGTSRDPVGAGFVRSLAKPGGNITGLTGDPALEVQSKHLQLLRQAVPNATRVALMWNPSMPGAAAYRETAEGTARALGVAVLAVPIRAREDLDAAFATMAKERIEALMLLSDPLTFVAREQLMKLVAQYRLPAVFHRREFVDLGGLLSYGSSLENEFRRAALYVDKILKGARPADLPIENPTQLELVINLKTAAALGLAIPQSLRLQADQVIQ